MASELIERRFKVPPEEVGKPLGQEEMLELLKARTENQNAYECFLDYSRSRAVFESLRFENSLIGAEILETRKQPDASEITLELRWPVKSDIVSGEDVYGVLARRAKSYPSTYSYITINFSRVQTKWLPDSGSEAAWTVSIEGEKVEDVFFAGGSLRPSDVEEAIKKAFSKPKTKDFETSGKNRKPPTSETE